MTVYENVTTLTKNYIGPAAEDFLTHQCRLFLKIEAKSMDAKHLPELAKCVEVGAMRFLNETKSKELAGKIARLN